MLHSTPLTGGWFRGALPVVEHNADVGVRAARRHERPSGGRSVPSDFRRDERRGPGPWPRKAVRATTRRRPPVAAARGRAPRLPGTVSSRGWSSCTVLEHAYDENGT